LTSKLSAQTIAAMTEEQARLIHELKRWLARFETGTRAWSAVYNTCAFGALILSAAAALILKLTAFSFPKEDVAALCSTVAAILSTAVATGGFQRKWRANRKARSALQLLSLDVEGEDVDLHAARERLKQIIEEQDAGTLGPAS
jgi:uncharacterized protein YjiS (DUF1127 family)